MVNFRRMRLGDLDSIYKDPEIRPLITTSSKEPKFAVVLEEENFILGGVTGYLVENAAFLQHIALKEQEESSLYKDGLIRSLIHFLELDGVEYLFVGTEDPVYPAIGFRKLQGTESFLLKLEKSIHDEFKTDPIYWIDLGEFFQR